MQYSIQCPAEDCQEKLTAEAGSYEEAATGLLIAGADHAARSHFDINMNPKQLEKVVRSQL